MARQLIRDAVREMLLLYGTFPGAAERQATEREWELRIYKEAVKPLESDLAEARRQRDLQWYEIATRYFEDLRSPAELEGVFKSDGIMHGTIHEIWKRNPKVDAALRENEALRRTLGHLGSAVITAFSGGRGPDDFERGLLLSGADAAVKIAALKPGDSPTPPKCSICGKLATCIGSYEGNDPPAPACDSCCGHGNEDGHCKPIEGDSPTPEAQEPLRVGPEKCSFCGDTPDMMSDHLMRCPVRLASLRGTSR